MAVNTAEQQLPQVVNNLRSVEQILEDPNHSPADLQQAVDELFKRFSSGEAHLLGQLETAMALRVRDGIQNLLTPENAFALRLARRRDHIVIARRQLDKVLSPQQRSARSPEAAANAPDFSEEYRKPLDGVMDLTDRASPALRTIVQDLLMEHTASLPPAERSRVLENFVAFLRRQIRKNTPIVGADQYGDLVDRVRETNSPTQNEELKLRLKAQIEKSQNDIKAKERRRGTLESQLSGKGAGKNTTLSENLNRQIDDIDADIDGLTTEITEANDQLRVIGEAEKQRHGAQVKIDEAGLLTLAHQYFMITDQNPNWPDDEMKAIADTFDGARTMAMNEIAEQKGETVRNQAFMRGIKIDLIVRYISNESVKDWLFLPEKLREPVGKELAKIGKKDLKNPTPRVMSQLVGRVDQLLASEISDDKAREKMLGRVMANTIAHLERAIDSSRMFERGLQRGHYKKISALRNAMQRAYEDRVVHQIKDRISARGSDLSAEDGQEQIVQALKDFSAEIERARSLSPANLPDELRKAYSEVDPAKRAGLWTLKKTGKVLKWGGIKLWGGLKLAHEKEIVKRSMDAIKKHPRLALAAGLTGAVLSAGSTVAVAATLYGGGWGLKKGASALAKRFGH